MIPNTTPVKTFEISTGVGIARKVHWFDGHSEYDALDQALICGVIDVGTPVDVRVVPEAEVSQYCDMFDNYVNDSGIYS